MWMVLKRTRNAWMINDESGGTLHRINMMQSENRNVAKRKGQIKLEMFASSWNRGSIIFIMIPLVAWLYWW